jgi:hypothetical protein
MAAQLLDAVKWEPTPSQLLAARVAVLAAEDMCTAVDAQTALLDIKEMLAQFPVEFSTGMLHGPTPAAPMCIHSPTVFVRA